MASIKPMHVIVFAVFFALLAPTGPLGSMVLDLLKKLPLMDQLVSSDMGSHAVLGVVFYFVTRFVLPLIESSSKFGAMDSDMESDMEDDD
jgi:hypothetical protein